MPFFRRLLLVAVLAFGCAAGVLRAGGEAAGAAPAAGTDEMLVILLEHHWVVEIGGHRFGLIQFDTPMTTVLLGQINFDLPVRAAVVLVPVLTVPLLAAIGIVMHGRRRRLGYFA